MKEHQREWGSTGRRRTYVLRLWWDPRARRPALRIALEDPETGEWQGFSDLGQFLNFLLDLAQGD